jgi:hypothetical protein
MTMGEKRGNVARRSVFGSKVYSMPLNVKWMNEVDGQLDLLLGPSPACRIKDRDRAASRLDGKNWIGW